MLSISGVLNILPFRIPVAINNSSLNTVLKPFIKLPETRNTCIEELAEPRVAQGWEGGGEIG